MKDESAGNHRKGAPVSNPALRRTALRRRRSARVGVVVKGSAELEPSAGRGAEQRSREGHGRRGPTFAQSPFGWDLGKLLGNLRPSQAWGIRKRGKKKKKERSDGKSKKPRLQYVTGPSESKSPPPAALADKATPSPTKTTDTTPAERTIASRPIPMAPADVSLMPASIPFAAPAAIDWVRHPHFGEGVRRASITLSQALLADPSLSGLAGSLPPQSAILALGTFCRLVGADAHQELRQLSEMSSIDAMRVSDLWKSDAACPVARFEEAAVGVDVEDLWFANDCDLRLRLGTTRGMPRVMRAFQYFPLADNPVALVCERLLNGRTIEFADLKLINPCFPILLTATTPEGQLLGATILPFPTLCRAGVHYGELCSIGNGSYSSVEALSHTSRVLLTELLRQAAPRELSVASICVDLQGATGAERIFTSAIKEWLATIMHVALRSGSSADFANPKVAEFLKASLGQSRSASGISADQLDAVDDGIFDLNLPADAIPSIQALVSRRLSIPHGASRAVGGFVVADGTTNIPRWRVQIPALGDEFLALQPSDAAIPYPSLTLRGSERVEFAEPTPSTAEALSVPLAIRFDDAQGRRPEELLLAPTAADDVAPILRGASNVALARDRTISVVVPFLGPDTNTLPGLLEWLRHQSLADCMDIIGVCRGSKPLLRQAIESTLRSYFPSRYLLLDDDGATSRLGRANHAATFAAGRFLLFIDQHILLGHHRSLESLCLLADHDGVASATCVVVKRPKSKKASALVYESGGPFVSGAGEPGRKHSDSDRYSVMTRATFPVAGITARLLMVRSDNWRDLGGFDGSSRSDPHGEAEYGARAIARGYIHYSTSAISAVDTEKNPAPGDVGTPANSPATAPSAVVLGPLCG